MTKENIVVFMIIKREKRRVVILKMVVTAQVVDYNAKAAKSRKLFDQGEAAAGEN